MYILNDEVNKGVKRHHRYCQILAEAREQYWNTAIVLLQHSSYKAIFLYAFITWTWMVSNQEKNQEIEPYDAVLPPNFIASSSSNASASADCVLNHNQSTMFAVVQ